MGLRKNSVDILLSPKKYIFLVSGYSTMLHVDTPPPQKKNIQGLDQIIGTLLFLVLYHKRPTRAAPTVGGLAVFFEFCHGP